MERVFGGRGIAAGACVLGSIKSSIGHSKAAAGVASMIKVALCLHHRVLPPTLNLQRPNPYWNAETSPFSFRERSQPWIGRSRVAGISAFGFGGTNYHAVLTSHDGDELPEAGLPAWPAFKDRNAAPQFIGDSKEWPGADALNRLDEAYKQKVLTPLGKK